MWASLRGQRGGGPYRRRRGTRGSGARRPLAPRVLPDTCGTRARATTPSGGRSALWAGAAHRGNAAAKNAGVAAAAGGGGRCRWRRSRSWTRSSCRRRRVRNGRGSGAAQAGLRTCPKPGRRATGATPGPRNRRCDPCGPRRRCCCCCWWRYRSVTPAHLRPRPACGPRPRCCCQRRRRASSLRRHRRRRSPDQAAAPCSRRRWRTLARRRRCRCRRDRTCRRRRWRPTRGGQPGSDRRCRIRRRGRRLETSAACERASGPLLLRAPARWCSACPWGACPSRNSRWCSRAWLLTMARSSSRPQTHCASCGSASASAAAPGATLR
mmetsp:Transcript_46104/g.141985  ORF Transcript_46104/g.141985 Transcript_46104/m.141985 type:complete len:324 (-) Transcript_46104:1133-2104(-)